MLNLQCIYVYFRCRIWTSERKSRRLKSKPDIKKELEESIINRKEIENIDTQEKVNICTINEDAEKLVQKFEEIIKNIESNIFGWPTINSTTINISKV